MKFFIAVFLSSLIALPAWAGVNNQVSIDVIKHPSKTWRFNNVKAYVSEKGVRVKGYLTADHTFGLPKGHIDIAVYSADGNLIKETTSKHFPRKLRYKAGRKGKVRFSADFAETLAPNSAIKIAFHSSNKSVKANSAHHNTIIQ